MMHDPARVQLKYSCSELLTKLEEIWNDIGESREEKDRMLLGLERECLEIYRRKVDEAMAAKAQLRKSLAGKEAELATLMAALGEVTLQKNAKSSLTLKEELSLVAASVDDLRREKEERRKVVADIRSQIDKISKNIYGFCSPIAALNTISLDEEDYSRRRLINYKKELQNLQNEKSGRMKKVLKCVNEVHCLCEVLGLDFSKTISDIHPSLDYKGGEENPNISDSTLQGLHEAISGLKAERRSRIEKLRDIFTSLKELWDMMESSNEERSKFSSVTSVLDSCESDVTNQGDLSVSVIHKAGAELDRLGRLKASKMKDFVIRRRVELETICRMTHIEPDPSTCTDKSTALIDSGLVDPSEILRNIEEQIIKAKNEALHREEIIERISRWLSACKEEIWLDDYNQDENRFNAGKGSHLNLKRAERARLTISKIPAMVDGLISKTLVWEEENATRFLYDGVCLVSLLEDYKLERQQKEEEKRRYRERKKQHDAHLNEKECMYGSKPSPKRSNSFRGQNGCVPNGNGSVSPTLSRTSVSSPSTTEFRSPRSSQDEHLKVLRKFPSAPINFVLMTKEDTFSHASVHGSECESLHWTL